VKSATYYVLAPDRITGLGRTRLRCDVCESEVNVRHSMELIQAVIERTPCPICDWLYPCLRTETK
jgi:hypothetical protein